MTTKEKALDKFIYNLFRFQEQKDIERSVELAKEDLCDGCKIKRCFCTEFVEYVREEVHVFNILRVKGN